MKDKIYEVYSYCFMRDIPWSWCILEIEPIDLFNRQSATGILTREHLNIFSKIPSSSMNFSQLEVNHHTARVKAVLACFKFFESNYTL